MQGATNGSEPQSQQATLVFCISSPAWEAVGAVVMSLGYEASQNGANSSKAPCGALGLSLSSVSSPAHLG